MKIKRTINVNSFTAEIEIELNSDELWEAYFEIEHENDIFDVSVELDKLLGLESEDKELLESIRHDREAVSRIAYQKRKNENRGMDWEDAAYEAITDDVEDYRECLTKVFGRS